MGKFVAFSEKAAEAPNIAAENAVRDFALRINSPGELPAHVCTFPERVASRRKCDVVHAAAGHVRPAALRNARVEHVPAYEQRILSSTTIFLSPLGIPGKLGDTGGRRGEQWRGDKISSEMSIDNDDRGRGREIPRGDACSEELARRNAQLAATFLLMRTTTASDNNEY